MRSWRAVVIGAGLVLSGLGLPACQWEVPPPPEGEAPVVTLTPQATKLFHFSWSDVVGETEYRLLEDPDGASGFEQVATLPADSTSYDLIVSLPARINARYVVQACTEERCAGSEPVSVTGTLATAIGYFKASNTGMDDEFGGAVALSGDGDTLAVGAPGEDSGTTGIDSVPDEAAGNAGAVYVFTRSGTTWRQQAYLKASNTGGGDAFGTSVALSGDGDTLAVGAHQEDSGTTGVASVPDEAAPNAGAVYVFARTGATWSQQAYVKASNTGDGDNFGWSVGLSSDGDTLAVGAWSEGSSTTGIDTVPDDAALFSGAAYVFARAGTTWSQQAYVKASNTGAADKFGVAVALSGAGDTLAVGAWSEDSSTVGVNSVPDEAAPEAGAVYIFKRSGTTWSEQAYVKASNTDAGDRFGGAVALSSDGNTLAVGARIEDSGTTGIDTTPDEAAPEAGAAYVYTRAGTVWSHQAYVKASNTGQGDQFGYAVALSSDGATLAVTAPLEGGSATGVNGGSDDLSPQAGAAYVFSRSGAAWGEPVYVKASNTALDALGVGLALSATGDVMAVATTSEDSSTTGVNSQPDEAAPGAGAVYLY